MIWICLPASLAGDMFLFVELFLLIWVLCSEVLTWCFIVCGLRRFGLYGFGVLLFWVNLVD